MLKNVLVYKPPKDSGPIAQNATIEIKYIMPDDDRYKKSMLDKGYKITIDDEEKIEYVLPNVDKNHEWYDVYYKKSGSHVCFNGKTLVNLRCLCKE